MQRGQAATQLVAQIGAELVLSTIASGFLTKARSEDFEHKPLQNR
jgi:hypothetical protein